MASYHGYNVGVFILFCQGHKNTYHFTNDWSKLHVDIHRKTHDIINYSASRIFGPIKHNVEYHQYSDIITYCKSWSNITQTILLVEAYVPNVIMSRKHSCHTTLIFMPGKNRATLYLVSFSITLSDVPLNMVAYSSQCEVDHLFKSSALPIYTAKTIIKGAPNPEI